MENAAGHANDTVRSRTSRRFSRPSGVFVLLDPTKLVQRARELPRKRAVFLTYQRTTFTDALRTAIRLQDQGAYEPIFLVSAERASPLEQEVNECRRRGITCLLQEEVLAGDVPLSFAPGGRQGRAAASARIARKLAVKLREQAALVWAILPRLLGPSRYERGRRRLAPLGCGRRWLLRRRRRTRDQTPPAAGQRGFS